jgi:two-component system nitrate/nitrite response regulator NarL
MTLQAKPVSGDRNGAKSAVRVVLVDSQAIYRVGMRKIFATESDIQVVAQFDSIADLQTSLPNHSADVLILEGGLITSNPGVISEILHQSPELKIVVEAAAMDEVRTVELYRSGARGIIPRAISPDLLIKCVRKVAEGETWIDNKAVTWVIEAYRSQAANSTGAKNQHRLSPKELTIIHYITQGKRNKEIAHELGTSEQVIKNYLRKIYDKLGVSDRLELALYSLNHKLHLKGSPVEINSLRS